MNDTTARRHDWRPLDYIAAVVVAAALLVFWAAVGWALQKVGA